VWLDAKRASIRVHEEGKGHKLNSEKRIEHSRKERDDRQRAEATLATQLRDIERAAVLRHEADVGSSVAASSPAESSSSQASHSVSHSTQRHKRMRAQQRAPSVPLPSELEAAECPASAAEDDEEKDEMGLGRWVDVVHHRNRDDSDAEQSEQRDAVQPDKAGGGGGGAVRGAADVQLRASLAVSGGSVLVHRSSDLSPVSVESARVAPSSSYLSSLSAVVRPHVRAETEPGPAPSVAVFRKRKPKP